MEQAVPNEDTFDIHMDESMKICQFCIIVNKGPFTYYVSHQGGGESANFLFFLTMGKEGFADF